MTKRNFPFRFLFSCLVAVVAWLGVTVQFYLSLHSALVDGREIASGLVSYFGYFTILTNILVALAVTLPMLAAKSPLGKFFARAGVNTALAAAIAIVALAYSFLLRHTWDPQGLYLFADEILHDVTPVLFLCYWWFHVPKSGMRWRDIFYWLLYPIGYLVYVMTRGALFGQYPYHFIDVPTLGYTQALLNAFGILMGYVFVALALVAAARLKERRESA